MIHRGVLSASDVGTLRGLRLTSSARTVVDLASVVDDETLEIALDCVLARQMTTIEQIERALNRAGSRGRVGTRLLRQMLSARAEGKPLGMSPLEVRFVRLLRRERISLPVPQFEVRLGERRYVIDYAYPAERVAIELDGYRWHSSPDRLVTDRRKSNAVTLAGWQLLRFTDPDVKTEPRVVVASVLAARGNHQLMV